MTRLLAIRDARQLLSSGKPAEALSVIRPFANRDSEPNNLKGVALLRLGRANEALGVFESLVFKSNGISLRKNVSELLLTNLDLKTSPRNVRMSRGSNTNWPRTTSG